MHLLAFPSECDIFATVGRDTGDSLHGGNGARQPEHCQHVRPPSASATRSRRPVQSDPKCVDRHPVAPEGQQGPPARTAASAVRALRGPRGSLLLTTGTTSVALDQCCGSQLWLTCCSASGDLSGAGIHSPALGGGLRPGSALPQWNPRPQRQEWKDPRPGVRHHRRDSPTVWLTNGKRQGAKVVPPALVHALRPSRG
jgi:hypothetical protein